MCICSSGGNGRTSAMGLPFAKLDGPDPIPLHTTCVTFASSHIMCNDYAAILDGCLTRNDYSGINNKISVWSNMFHEISCVVSMNET